MYKTGYNPSDNPLVVDTDGRVIGGREWGTYSTTDDVAKTLIADGRLIEANQPEGGDLNPDAVAAFQRTEETASRAEAVTSLDKDTLRQTAEEAGLIEEDEKVGVADLREAVAEHTEVKVPSKSKSKREA